ncbi:MAG: c-type cytochrome [Limimaricola soesokkakensis]|uniref:Cytochrome c n=1 Tax=Limimaricola soesokkakensis TaxID=1343159 RepID=A0A1X6YL70_9RHOB|nr:c-type cytochrome [Limimaricola soesokkakensis]PSK88511.1 cytochrome c [Limimaricola soesokkakensis]SLN24024.1 Cytochrome c2 [Limimaricola soesokkakensis]
MNLLSRGTALALAGLGLWSAPATAQDVANGEVQFGRQCVACHVVRDPEGRVLAGRNARTGPNLYGIEGRVIGSVEDFRYGDAMIRLRDRGMEWDEESFLGYVTDPTAWLRATLDDRRARGKMAYQVRDPQDAADIYAYIEGLSTRSEAAN